MRSTISLFLLLCSVIVSAQVNIIPQPVEVKQQTGVYLLKDKITVSSVLPAHNWPRLFNYLRDEMKMQFNISVTESPKGVKGDIDFFMTRMPTSGKPAYQLYVTGEGVSIKSNFDEPTFHAIQTLFQLIPLSGKKEIPFVEIFDHARFDYRGMHLDVARHFFPVSFIKRYIDYLAYHKFNTFHWHLTDDQGWRIEIKKYPKLTSVGGWRNGTIIGRYPGTGNDRKKHGGFYTQAEVKEVVKYAADRFITVIPEIEMPGHASAAIAAHPVLSCFPEGPTPIPKGTAWNGSKSGKQVQQTWGVFDDVFCAGKETTFYFLEDVLKEVMALFPSKYIHIGGDECPKTNWKKCVLCQRRMKENKLKDEHELQSYFIQRIGKYLDSNGRTLIGWDEILEGGLAPNAVVMSWRGEQGGIDAAKQKHKVIMTPGNPVYFDHSQTENEDSVTIGGFNPIEKVYAYEPIPKELNEEEAKYIMGAQANLWTEYIKNTKKVEYMLFPRMSALSEVLWSTKENRNWEDFQKRLLVQFKRYELWNTNYSKAYFDLKAKVIPSEDYDRLIWKIESRTKEKFIDFRIIEYNGVTDTIAAFDTEPTDIFTIGSTQEILVFGSNSTIKQKFFFNKATGKKITITKEPDSKYPGDGAFTLVNGVINEKGFDRSKEFIGFSGEDCEAIIDLGAKTDFKQVTVNTLTRTSSWIWPPKYADFMLSDDGINFRKPDTGIFSDIEPFMGRKTRLRWHEGSFSARYIKVFIKNWGAIPAGNPGAGSKAWLFVDEIEVE